MTRPLIISQPTMESTTLAALGVMDQLRRRHVSFRRLLWRTRFLLAPAQPRNHVTEGTSTQRDAHFFFMRRNLCTERVARRRKWPQRLS